MNVSYNKNSGTVIIRNVRNLPVYGVRVTAFDNGKTMLQNILFDGRCETEFRFSTLAPVSGVPVEFYDSLISEKILSVAVNK